MRKSVCLYAILLTVFITPFTRASADSTKDLSVVALKDAPDFAKRALVIGIDHYLHVPKLQVCAKDAHHFADLLKTKFGYTDVVLMTDESGTPEDLNPTNANIKYQLRALKNGVIGGQTEVVLFFSGHGARTQSQQSGDADWLVPLDGDATDIPETCINYTVFENALETKQPARALLVMDACRNLEPGKGLDSGSGFGAPKPLGPQIAQLLSCQPTEISREGLPGDFSESVFTHYLIAGLEGDRHAVAQGTNAVTFDSLKLYVQGAVSAYVRSHFDGAIQIPDGQAKLGSMVLAKFDLGEDKHKDIDTIAHLHLHVTPEGATVLLDGVAQSGDEIAVDLGTDKTRIVEIGVKQDQYKAKVQQVTLTRGESDDLTVKLERLSIPVPTVSKVSKTKINPIDGAEMILIPAGEFTMGYNPRKVTLGSYYIYKNDVTVAQYKKFCKATSRTMPEAPSWGWDKEEYPIVRVTWDDAQAYAKWAAVSLPTEKEWEKAARGMDGSTYPWGNTWDPAKCRNNASSPSAVGSYPAGASPYGVLDMEGNVGQWCSYLYKNADAHVIRGGGWDYYLVDSFRCAGRIWYLSGYTKYNLGFRCVFRLGS